MQDDVPIAYFEPNPSCPYCGETLRTSDDRCAHCLSQLGASCPECGVVTFVSARFCSQCGCSLPWQAAPQTGLAGSLIRTERRTLTVVFCDLVSSTALATSMDPEDFTEIISTFQRCVTDVMTRHGGFCARYMGDGALFYFGYPRAEEDDTERAVRASLATVEAVSALSRAGIPQLQMRVGISSGLAIIGGIAGAGVRGLDVAGEAPNLAARLQGFALPGTILIAHNVYRLIGHVFKCRDLGGIELKGWREPVQAWQVLRPAPVIDRFKARNQTPLPLIGRATELGRMLSRWYSARRGQGGVVLLSGEAGIGKSRLIAELLVTASQERRHLFFCCAQHQQSIPLHPVIQRIERAAKFSPGDKAPEKRAKLARLLTGATEQDFGMIYELIGIAPARSVAPLQLSAQKHRERALEAAIRILARFSQSHPLLVVLEDAQWSDPTSLELLSLAVQRVRDLPILLFVTARPEFRPDWSDKAGVESITLAPLRPEDSTSVVRCVSGAFGLPTAVVGDIVTRSDGVPLFLEEVTKAILEQGKDAGSRRPNGGSAMPLSLHTSLLARLDRLGSAREIAEIAAAIGREFSAELLGRVTGQPETVLHGAIGRLLDSGLVFHSGPPGSFRFKHALIQDAAYGMIVRDRRRQLHGRIAEALGTSQPDLPSTQPQLLAHHYTEAGHLEQAVAWWLRAATLSLLRSATAEAFAHLDRALDLLQLLPDNEWRRRHELELRVVLGKALITTQGHTVPLFGETFERARTLCDQLDAPPQLLTVLFCQWTHSLLGADLAMAAKKAEELLALGERRADPVWILIGSYAFGFTMVPQGRFENAGKHLQRGLALYDPGKRDAYAGPVIGDPRVVMLSYLSRVSMCMGHFDRARRELQEALETARAYSQVYTLEIALSQDAYLGLVLGPTDQGLCALEELHHLAQEYGSAYFGALATLLRGFAVGMAGDARQGLAMLRAGQASYNATGSRLWVPSFVRMEAELLARTGAFEESLHLVNRAARIIEDTGARWDESELQRLRGEILLRAGDLVGAEAALRDARRMAVNQDAKLYELRAVISLAELLASKRSHSEAARELEPVSAWFDGRGTAVDLMRAHALLRTLQ